MTGSRGPLPKPAALKLLEGNPGKRALNLSDGVNPRVQIPSAPDHLGKEARKEWKRITPLLEELGLISGLDRAALALYCQAVGRLSELEMAFNGKVKQRGSTSDMVFDVAELVSWISSVMTLLPGDVILTGTPAGVGPMKAGDDVSVTIEGVGTLTNPVVDRG